jgi:molecular chaperone HscB
VNDPFQLLGLEPRFDLDLKLLDEQHKQLSLAVHPDRLRGQSSLERRQSLTTAMAINEAHRIVRDPASRALALLEARGQSRHDLRGAPLEPSALEVIMDAREALLEARTTGNQLQILALQRNAEAARNLALLSIQEVFRTVGALGVSELERLDRALGELRYHERFLLDVESTED